MQEYGAANIETFTSVIRHFYVSVFVYKEGVFISLFVCVYYSLHPERYKCKIWAVFLYRCTCSMHGYLE
jgi:hypothetical protein